MNSDRREKVNIKHISSNYYHFNRTFYTSIWSFAHLIRAISPFSKTPPPRPFWRAFSKGNPLGSTVLFRRLWLQLDWDNRVLRLTVSQQWVILDKGISLFKLWTRISTKYFSLDDGDHWILKWVSKDLQYHNSTGKNIVQSNQYKDKHTTSV